MFHQPRAVRPGTGSSEYFRWLRQKAGDFARYHTIAVFGLLALVLLLGAGSASSSAVLIPTFSVASVAPDQTVTIVSHNFPHNQTFTVRMGAMGTRGIGGTVVGTTNSGSSSSFTATYNIPAELKGASQIAIRLDSPQGFYSFNWFYNVTGGDTGGPATPAYRGIPTFKIVSVATDQNVTIETNNFPANQTFTVTMGPMGTRGIGGTVVGTIASGSGGTLTQTFDIPAALHNSRQISIRAQTAHARPYFAYNWFYNATAGDTGGPGPTPPPPTTGYSGIPTFKVCSVTRDTSVTIVTNNFPANQSFTVTMGPMGTRGIGGTAVGTIESGSGGTLTQTFNIPAHLHGSSRIAIRAQTAHARPYFTFNWFYNNTASVC